MTVRSLSRLRDEDLQSAPQQSEAVTGIDWVLDTVLEVPCFIKCYDRWFLLCITIETIFY